MGGRRLGGAALVGRQTREHRDLDLAVDADDLGGWQSPGYDETPDRYDIAFTGGVNKLTVTDLT